MSVWNSLRHCVFMESLVFSSQVRFEARRVAGDVGGSHAIVQKLYRHLR